MALIRNQFATTSEYNTETSLTTTDKELQKASDFIASILSHITINKTDGTLDDSKLKPYQVNYVKLATIYQVEYWANNGDTGEEDNSVDNVSLGSLKVSLGNSKNDPQERFNNRLSPRTQEYLNLSDLLYSGMVVI